MTAIIKTGSTFTPLEVTFTLDGRGVYYNPSTPPMLDSLITYAPVPVDRPLGGLKRDERPIEFPKPLAMWNIGGQRGFCASALFPPEGEPAYETVLMWRKKFRVEYADTYTQGSPNIRGGPMREYNQPIPLLLTRRLVGWCVGDHRKVLRTLQKVRYLGKYARIGIGRICDLKIDRIDYDWSMTRDGAATRWLPHPDGIRKVRVRPPYWNIVDRVTVCEIGDAYGDYIVKRMAYQKERMAYQKEKSHYSSEYIEKETE